MVGHVSPHGFSVVATGRMPASGVRERPLRWGFGAHLGGGTFETRIPRSDSGPRLFAGIPRGGDERDPLVAADAALGRAVENLWKAAARPERRRRMLRAWAPWGERGVPGGFEPIFDPDEEPWRRLRGGRRRNGGRRDDDTAVARDRAALSDFLRRVAKAVAAGLDPDLRSLALVAPWPMRWWLYDVARAARDEMGERGLRHLRQAVECIPGVLALAFALDDPAFGTHGLVTRTLRAVVRGEGEAADHVEALLDAWKPAVMVDDGTQMLSPWAASVDVADPKVRLRQRQFVSRIGACVDPVHLLAPVLPGFDPQDVPDEPAMRRRYASFFHETQSDPRVVEVTTATGPEALARIGGFLSAHAVELWDASARVRSERLGAVLVAAHALGRRFGRRSDPRKVLELAAPFQPLVRSGDLPGRLPKKRAFPVPERLAFDEGGVRVEPIRDFARLVVEGAKMRNCVASYAEDLARGRRHLCVVEVDGARYHAEIRRRRGGRLVLRTILGHANASVTMATIDKIRPWIERAGLSLESSTLLRSLRGREAEHVFGRRRQRERNRGRRQELVARIRAILDEQERAFGGEPDGEPDDEPDELAGLLGQCMALYCRRVVEDEGDDGPDPAGGADGDGSPEPGG